MLIDTFPAFARYWVRARLLPLEDQIEGWLSIYLGPWPELAAKQIEDYQTQKIEWREVARERIFPFFDERMHAMETAEAILLELCEPVFKQAVNVMDISSSILFVLHAGIGCGAGWATTFQNSPAILFGLENIAELGWNRRDVLTGLIAHETGHLAHLQWRAEGNKPLGEDPWSQLFDEGFAQCCEKLILKTGCTHQSITEEESDWLNWCTEHKSLLATEFLRVVQANEPASKFFGSWFQIQGRSETGYFLGQEVMNALLTEGYSLREISQLDPEATARPILESFSRA